MYGLEESSSFVGYISSEGFEMPRGRIRETEKIFTAEAQRSQSISTFYLIGRRRLDEKYLLRITWGNLILFSERMFGGEMLGMRMREK